jgi:hypothetical protein
MIIVYLQGSDDVHKIDVTVGEIWNKKGDDQSGHPLAISKKRPGDILPQPLLGFGYSYLLAR